jgi:hypothetical protein
MPLVLVLAPKVLVALLVAFFLLVLPGMLALSVLLGRGKDRGPRSK